MLKEHDVVSWSDNAASEMLIVPSFQTIQLKLFS
jgi:hypothetical protein